MGAIERSRTDATAVTAEMKHVCRMCTEWLFMIIFYNLIASKINWRLIRFKQHAVTYVCVNMTLLKATTVCVCVRSSACVYGLILIDQDTN